MSENPQLAKNTLGGFESFVMGIAGTAPAFSVAVTTATIVSSVGVLSVGSVLYCGFIMFGITLAFIHLSKITPNAGAAYAWVGHVFGPIWGYFAGWGLLIASIFFMVSATIPAATSTLLLLAPSYIDSTEAVAGIAALWLTLITAVVTRGIKHSSYVQITFTVFETAILLALIIGGFIRYWGSPAHPPSVIWFSPFSFSPQLFATGALTAIFFFWGWDVTMNLSEESKSSAKRISGAASTGAFWSVLNMMLFFTIMIVVILIVLTDAEIASADTNVLFAVATKLFPEPWNYLAVFCTILSTVGTIETQILQFSRSLFSMARDGMLHSRYAKIHPQWQTPWAATVVIWAMGMLLLFTSSYMPSVKVILSSSILAIGFQICFYMSLAGFACAWHYRHKLRTGLGSALGCVLWPLMSALFMVFIALYSIPTFDLLTNLLGLGGLLIGFIPLMLNRK
ncbi:APC family permease [Polynucleobacter sp. AM-25C3]|uniref:APC family permease n=1 Tax=Polynucleobacter sp. AM-25C3 TaxID=1855569 RepID=UPI001C0C8DE5|nr:APC family permease [Polynucleobacter sp. AM-25C3]MBU3602530.1 APC family permease [Polynucleobacter sp. AM-25C3]